MKPKYRNSQFLGASLVTVITVCFGSSAFALDNLWTGSVSNDWNVGGNWSDPHAFGSPHVPSNAAGHPGDEDAIINSTSPANYPVVVANPTSNPRDVKIGKGAGAIGRIDHSSGTVSTGSGNWLAVGLDGGTGTYNLALPAGSGGTLTGMGQSAGSVNANGALYVPITGGSTGTFNMHTTGTVAVSGLLAVGDGGTGNFKMDSGTITVGGEFWVGQGATGNGTFAVNAGQITINSWIAVGRDGGTGVLNMTGATTTITKSAANPGSAFIVGASGPGTFNQSAGTVTVAAGDTWIGENGKGTYNLNGGELSGTVVQVGRNSAATDCLLNLSGGTLRLSRLIGGASANEQVTFNGTQIIAKTDQAAFIDGLNIAIINGGGFKIDSAGKNIASAQILDGVGGITKTGTGTFTLTGAQLYDGATAINGGKMVNGSSAEVRGAFTVADGATFGVTTSDEDGQLIVASLTTGTTAAGTGMDFNLGGYSGNSTFHALKVNGNLVVNGNVTVNISDQLPTVGQIPLIKYTPANRSGTGQFVLGALPLGVNGTLITDTVNGVVYLNVTSVALPRWEGDINGEWNFVTQNWNDLVSGLPIAYTDNTPVLFNDDPFGTSTTAINLAAGIDVKPSLITINNSNLVYSFSGPGKISGPTTLTKSGSAALTISNTNEYTGATSFVEGPVSIATLANGGAPSSIGSSGAAPSNLLIGASAVTYTGPSVSIDRGFTINGTGASIDTANNIEFKGLVATNTGNLTKLGTGNVTFSNAGANVFGTVNQGLKVNGGTATFTGGGTQTNTVAGELWIGSVPDVPAHVVLNGGTLNVGSWIALGRGNGATGVLSTLTATNSTIQSTNFSTGFNGDLPTNDSDQTVTLSNTNWTNGGATMLAESQNSTTNMTLSGTSQYTGTATNEGGRLQSALGQNSVANLTLSGSSQMNIKGRFQIGFGVDSSATVTVEGNAGIVKAGEWTSIGNSNNSTGTLNVKDNGTFTTNGDFNISDTATSKGVINLSGSGTITSTGQTFVGKNGAVEGGTTGTINQSGGTYNCSNWISVGRFNFSTGTVNVSGGTFNQTSADQGIIVGEEGLGTLNVTGGNVNVTGNPGILVSNSATANGTVNLKTGGTITTKRVSAGAAGAGAATFNFDGGKLVAGAGANADFFSGMDSANVLVTGGEIDSGVNVIGISQNFTGAGGIKKSGTGTLYLNGTSDNAGMNVVSAGTLGGTGEIVNLTVNSGASVNPGAPLGVFITNTTVFSAGSSLTIDLDASPDMLAAINLTLNNTALVLNGTPTQPVYLLARYGSRTGTFATAPPAGYVFDYNYMSDGFSHIALVQTGGGSPYATWINTFFPGVTNQAIIGETADPDGDGSTNALEFALGGAPNSGSNNPKVYSLQEDGSVDGDTNKELLLTIAVRSGTPAFSPATGGSPTATQDGFVYTIQGSVNLSGFATGVTVVNPVAPVSNPTPPTGYVYRTFSLDGSNNLTGKGFLRARVNKAP